MTTTKWREKETSTGTYNQVNSPDKRLARGQRSEGIRRTHVHNVIYIHILLSARIQCVPDWLGAPGVARPGPYERASRAYHLYFIIFMGSFSRPYIIMLLCVTVCVVRSFSHSPYSSHYRRLAIVRGHFGGPFGCFAARRRRGRPWKLWLIRGVNCCCVRE